MRILTKVLTRLSKQQIINKECKRYLSRTANVKVSGQDQAAAEGDVPCTKWQCKELSEYPNLSIITSEIANKDGLDWLSNFPVELDMSPTKEFLDEEVFGKFNEYAAMKSSRVTIEWLMGYGDKQVYSEEQSYRFLKDEVAIRLAHMISQLQYIPKPIRDNEKTRWTIQKYCQSFQEVLEFKDKSPSPAVMSDFMKTLETFKFRHKDTVENIAQAVGSLKEKEKAHEHTPQYSEFFRNIHWLLNRLFKSRIGIHLITDHHLEVYGSFRPAPNSIGIIKPLCDMRSILDDAVQEATLDIEQIYMACPKVEIEIHNSVQCGVPPNGHCVPDHLSKCFREVLKNAMRATVEHHRDKLDELPAIKALVCQSNDDFTIGISDQGGGMPRETVRRSFYYHNSKWKGPNDENNRAEGMGLGIAKLYARYFGGDLRVVSLEGYGTTVYIYTHALNTSAREETPCFARDKKRIDNMWAWMEEDWVDYWKQEQGHPIFENLSPEMIAKKNED